MGLYEELKEKIVKAVEAGYEEAVVLSDWMSDHPEVSGSEYETSAKLVEYLKGHGFEVEYPYAGIETAFRGIYGSNNHKHKVAIMAEYDALPGVGHACGHSLSGAMSVLAAVAIKDLQEELNCDIHLIGTPNEENDGAKCGMIESGVFDEYEEAIMIHLFDKNQLYCKLLGLHQFEYTFYGKPAHGATAPWEGINALNAAQLMFHGIDCLRQHVTPDVRMHGVYRNGGLAPNVVPAEASIEFYTRALEKKYHLGLDEKLDKIAEGACLMTGCTYKKELTAAMYDNMNNNFVGIQAMEEVYNEVGVELNGDPEVIFGSSDAGNVSFVCPTFHPTLQIVDKGIAIHTKDFEAAIRTERGHKSIENGAKIIALHIAKIFSDEEKIAAMKAEFEESVKGL